MGNTYNGMPIIDDGTTDAALLHPPGLGKGLELPPKVLGRQYKGTADAFPQNLLVPKSEVQARVEERKSAKRTLQALCDWRKIPPKNQGQTNFCWVNSPTYAVEVIRLVQNQPMVLLSPASAGAQITHYQNVGGWGKQALQWISDRGLVPVDKWPANAISSQYATDENIALAKNYRCTEWWELSTDNMQETWSCLLLDIPVCAGLSWWSHEVTYIDVDWIDGDVAIVFRNSWGPSYGNNGYSVLQGQRMQPDDAVAPRQAVAA